MPQALIFLSMAQMLFAVWGDSLLLALLLLVDGMGVGAIARQAKFVGIFLESPILSTTHVLSHLGENMGAELQLGV